MPKTISKARKLWLCLMRIPLIWSLHENEGVWKDEVRHWLHQSKSKNHFIFQFAISKYFGHFSVGAFVCPDEFPQGFTRRFMWTLEKKTKSNKYSLFYCKIQNLYCAALPSALCFSLLILHILHTVTRFVLRRLWIFLLSQHMQGTVSTHKWNLECFFLSHAFGCFMVTRPKETSPTFYS